MEQGDQTTQTPFTTQTLNNMLSQLGITVPNRHQYAAEKRGGGDGHRVSSRPLVVRDKPLTLWSLPWVTLKACAAERC